jgi:hypothetical protein
MFPHGGERQQSAGDDCVRMSTSLITRVPQGIASSVSSNAMNLSPHSERQQSAGDDCVFWSRAGTAQLPCGMRQQSSVDEEYVLRAGASVIGRITLRRRSRSEELDVWRRSPSLILQNARGNV